MYKEVFKLHADLLKALAHPRRLEIINLLQGQELSVSDIQEMLALPQANLSQHLMLLRKHGVVSYRKEGKKVLYKVAHQNFVKASDLMRLVLIERYRKGSLAKDLTRSIKQFMPIVTDPVCGMRLSAKTAAASSVLDNQTYYFCATGCKNKFVKAPRRFIAKHKVAHVVR